MKDQKYIYIASFIFSIILIYWMAGAKPTFYYLLIVLAGMGIYSSGKYTIRIDTPDIMKQEV
jgi:hypothetical protein